MAMYSDLLAVPILLGVVAFISLALNVYQHGRISALKKGGGEFEGLRREADKQENPIGVMVDKGSKAIPFICTVSETNDIMLETPVKKNKWNRKTNYNLVAPFAAPTSNQIDIKGIGRVSLFPMPYHFPFNIHDSAALCRFGDLIEKDAYLGAFGNTIKMLELSFNRSGTFRTECIKYIRTAVEFNLEHGQHIKIPFQPRNIYNDEDNEYTEGEDYE